MCVSGSKSGDKDNDTRDDQTNHFLWVLVALNENVPGVFAHEVESDKTPEKTDSHDGTETHQEAATSNSIYHDHAAK